jgi:transcriptional regulator with XRE-family HTH domain
MAMRKPSDSSPIDKYNARFAATLRDFMERHPDTGEKTTQKALADYLSVRPQTVSYYCTGESLPNCEQLLRIADFFGVTCDFLMTGRRTENKPVREMLGLSELTVQNMKMIKDGYFEDTPYMLAALDGLLGEKDFYISIERAVESYRLKETAPSEMEDYFIWKAAQFMEDFLLDFFSSNITSIYKGKRGYDE